MVLEVATLYGSTKRLVGEMAVRGGIDGKNEGGEVDVKAGLVGPNEPASRLVEMGAKAVEGFGKGRNV
jgi:hypothetical protein